MASEQLVENAQLLYTLEESSKMLGGFSPWSLRRHAENHPHNPLGKPNFSRFSGTRTNPFRGSTASENLTSRPQSECWVPRGTNGEK